MIAVINIDKPSKKLIERLYSAALKHFAVSEDFDVTVTFVGVDRIRRLNSEYRGIDKATDVLTFPNMDIKLPFVRQKHLNEINPENNRFFLGDIIVSLQIAKLQAEEYNHSLTREIIFLVLHGLLHLFGFDHMNAAEENIMKEHQKKILCDLGVLR